MSHIKKHLLNFFSFLIVSFISLNAFSQITDGGSIPLSFKSNFNDIKSVRQTTLDAPDMNKINQEDKVNDLLDNAVPRIGVLVSVNKGFEIGKWDTLPNGDRLWRAKLNLTGAKATNLYFDKFYLPKNSKLHFYNADKSEVLGGFSTHNNNVSQTFVTSLILGDHIIIEYFEPSNVKGQGIIHISDMGFAYRDVKPNNEIAFRGFGDSEDCQVNVNCSEGTGKEKQRDAAVRILLKVGNQFGWCSGAVVNNTAKDKKPYILSAWHCGMDSDPVDFNQWVFYFNYQSNGCSSPTNDNDIPNQSITGAVVRANSDDGGGVSGSDLMLLELNNDIPTAYNVYYAGWDANNTIVGSGYGIHHPSGDGKKISTFTTNIFTTGQNVSNSHWAVQWASTQNGHGTTEGGSSGSPLFNNSGYIIGTLTGGSSTCSSPNGYDVYGKMSYHWTSNGSSNDNQLKPWLDPLNSGVTILDGDYNPTNLIVDAGIKAINNPIDNGFICNPSFTPQVIIKNFGSDNLTSATINYQLNNDQILTYNWIGNLANNEEEIITLAQLTAPSSDLSFRAFTSNPNGVVDLNSGNDEVISRSSVIVSINLPYTTDFESGIPNDIFIDDASGDNKTWEITSTSAFGNGSNSIYYNNYDNNAAGSYDWIDLPAFDLSLSTNTQLTFDVAYAPYNSQYSDTLIVAYSTDCGQSFYSLYKKGGLELDTKEEGYLENDPGFTPTANEWRTEVIDLSFLDNSSSPVKISIINKSAWGNPIYIDNINVAENVTLSINSNSLNDNLKVTIYPNPSSGNFNIKSLDRMSNVDIYDVNGVLIFKSKIDNKNFKINNFNVSKGMYIVNINFENGSVIRRLITIE